MKEFFSLILRLCFSLSDDVTTTGMASLWSGLIEFRQMMASNKSFGHRNFATVCVLFWSILYVFIYWFEKSDLTSEEDLNIDGFFLVRKRGLLLNNLTGVVGAGLMGLSKSFFSYEMLIIGRFIIGFNCGLNTSLVPMYISEIAPLTLRGGLGTVNQLGCTVGILFSQILGIQEILGTTEGWPILLGIQITVMLLNCILIYIWFGWIYKGCRCARPFSSWCCSLSAQNHLDTCSSLLTVKKTLAQVISSFSPAPPSSSFLLLPPSSSFLLLPPPVPRRTSRYKLPSPRMPKESLNRNSEIPVDDSV